MLHGTTLMTPGRGVARPSCNGNPRPALAGSSEVASGVMICGACTLSRSLKTSEPVRFLIAFAYSPILYHKNEKSQLKTCACQVNADEIVYQISISAQLLASPYGRGVSGRLCRALTERATTERRQHNAFICEIAVGRCDLTPPEGAIEYRLSIEKRYGGMRSCRPTA